MKQITLRSVTPRVDVFVGGIQWAKALMSTTHPGPAKSVNVDRPEAPGPDGTERARVIRVGCSGWSYNDWREVVYPPDLPRRRWLEHYQQLFDTVELNSTFYRLPTPEAVEVWASTAPLGFLFAFKLGGFGSHRKKLRDPETWLPNHLDRAMRLGTHLGPTLVQLPPRRQRNAQRLDAFLTLMPATTRCAVELRVCARGSIGSCR